MPVADKPRPAVAAAGGWANRVARRSKKGQSRRIHSTNLAQWIFFNLHNQISCLGWPIESTSWPLSVRKTERPLSHLTVLYRVDRSDPESA